MKSDLNTDDIALLIAQARRQRSDMTGELIAGGSRKALAWLARTADRLLHALLMSPVPRPTQLNPPRG